MIKSCEEVKTIDNFDELVLFRSKTVRIGLRETAGWINNQNHFLKWVNPGCKEE